MLLLFLLRFAIVFILDQLALSCDACDFGQVTLVEDLGHDVFAYVSLFFALTLVSIDHVKNALTTCGCLLLLIHLLIFGYVDVLLVELLPRL